MKKYALTEHDPKSIINATLAAKTLRMAEKKLIKDVHAVTLVVDIGDTHKLYQLKNMLNHFMDLKATLELIINTTHKPEDAK